MKFTDYKFWFIRRNDDGLITEAAVRFYEGGYRIIDGKSIYVRTKRLERFEDLKHLLKNGKIKALRENTSEMAVLYYPDDFGLIKTEEELSNFLDKEISKDKGRIFISTQNIK